VTLTRADVVRDLRGMDVGLAQVVFVHSSLSSLGWVEGGAEAVIDAWPQEGVFLLGAPVLIAGFLLELGRWWDKRGAHGAAGTGAATGAGAEGREASASTEAPTAPAPTSAAAVDVQPAPRPQEAEKRDAVPSA
jgi:hypothetical protein